MQRPETSTPTGDKSDRDALARLEADLTAFETERRKAPSLPGVGAAASEGYRLLGQILGGILGGVGLGWLMDHFVHTRPWGVVIGVFGGAALSVYSTVRMASRTGPSAKSETTTGPGPGSPGDVQARDDGKS
jgi:ATP synthase protein I